MKNVLVLLVGLLIGGGLVIFMQKKPDDAMAQKDAQIQVIKDALAALTSREQELLNKLSESENDRVALQSQITGLQNRLTGPGPETTGLAKPEPVPEPARTTDKKQSARENMRRYAKAILRASSGKEKNDVLEKDPALQATFMEFMADMMKIMAKCDINFNMRGGSHDEIYKAYEFPEIRQWFCELSACMFEELGCPLTESQIAAVDERMRLTAEEGRKLDDPNLSRLEKAILQQRFQSMQKDEYAKIFTDEQNKKLPAEASFLIGDSHDSAISARIDQSKTKEECANIIAQGWGIGLKLNETEKQNVKYISNMYILEYGTLKSCAEAEYGKEFMDYYLERCDRSNKNESRKFQSARREYLAKPENKSKKYALDLCFAELQLKYQKQLQNTFPEKTDLIKTQYPAITHFPNLEN